MLISDFSPVGLTSHQYHWVISTGRETEARSRQNIWSGPLRDWWLCQKLSLGLLMPNSAQPKLETSDLSVYSDLVC